jgi:adenylate kinase
MVVFLGGVHGVGKSTLAGLCTERNVEHLSASALIKKAATEARFDEKKRVKDVEGNQSILIGALEVELAKGGRFLLDGHFTLFNSSGDVETIPLATFKAIAPCGLGVITDTPLAIVSRLRERDQVGHDLASISRMQDREIQQAEVIAQALGLELTVFHPGDVQRFGDWLDNSFAMK